MWILNDVFIKEQKALKQKFELEHEIELDQIKQKGSTESQVCIF